MNITIDKTNLITGLEQILDYVKRGFKVKVQIEDSKKDYSSDYEEFMKKIDEEMKKEGIEFERKSFEEGRKSFLKNRKKIEKFLLSLK